MKPTRLETYCGIRNGVETRQLSEFKALYAAYKEMRLQLDAVDAGLERFRRRIERAAVSVTKRGL